MQIVTLGCTRPLGLNLRLFVPIWVHLASGVSRSLTDFSNLFDQAQHVVKNLLLSEMQQIARVTHVLLKQKECTLGSL